MSYIPLRPETSRPAPATRCLRVRARLKTENCRSQLPSTKAYSTYRRCLLPIKSITFHPRHKVNTWRDRWTDLSHPKNRLRDVQQPRIPEPTHQLNNKLSWMEPGTSARFVIKSLRSHRVSGDIDWRNTSPIFVLIVSLSAGVAFTNSNSTSRRNTPEWISRLRHRAWLEVVNKASLTPLAPQTGPALVFRLQCPTVYAALAEIPGARRCCLHPPSQRPPLPWVVLNPYPEVLD